MRAQLSPQQVFQPVPYRAVQINDHFWKPRIDGNRQVTLPYQYEQLITSGVLGNFQRVLGQIGGAYAGPFWMDSDAYKWLEAASYSLATQADLKLQQWVDDTIGLIASAQESNGYLHTYFQLVEPDKKFTNMGMCHELYCAGHLFQAAVANYKATGGQILLQVACRLADHIDSVFGPGKLEAADGHEEIETALVDLYRVTKECRYLELALFFVNQRGRSNSRLRWELGHLDEIAGKYGKPGQINRQFFGTYEDYDGRYAQDHLPVQEQKEAVGHAVRAMYLYCAMADLMAETGEFGLLSAMERLWENVTARRMYITGSIGPSDRNEGFTCDYDLPNDTAYGETCASVGMIMWNHRLLQLTGESRFADIMERVLYNGFLAGVSLDSRKFFYVNQLQSVGDHHRQGWFECACCPPNVARLLASLGNYIYSQSPEYLAIHLYIQGSVQVQFRGELVTLYQETNYPWEGKVQIKMELAKPTEFALLLRIPGWCRSFTVSVNGEPFTTSVENGYTYVKRNWFSGDQLMLVLEMPVEVIKSHPAVWQDMGRVAIQRGPVVYCLEEVDHSLAVTQIMLPKDAEFVAHFDPDLLEGITVIESEGVIYDLNAWEGKLYHPVNFPESYLKIPIKAVPYYTWDNRQPGSMAVWLTQK